jgi:hypothetical protein
MVKCKVCGKEIPDGLTYCSPRCKELDKNPPKTVAEERFLSQFDKGFGSQRRMENINRIIEMFQTGMAEDEIRYQLSFLFRPATIDNYLATAKEYLRRQKGLQ